jgi:hypothetical protein
MATMLPYGTFNFANGEPWADYAGIRIEHGQYTVLVLDKCANPKAAATAADMIKDTLELLEE